MHLVYAEYIMVRNGEREREREREREGKRTERDGKDHAEFARLILRNCAQIP